MVDKTRIVSSISQPYGLIASRNKILSSRSLQAEEDAPVRNKLMTQPLTNSARRIHYLLKEGD